MQRPTYMKIIAIGLQITVLFLAVPQSAAAFMLLEPPMNIRIDPGDVVGPEDAIADNQGFYHWDLRRLNQCKVPFNIADETADITGDDVIAGGNITSGLNGVVETVASGDDVQVIPFGNGEPDTLIIGPGGDGTVESVPQPGSDDGVIPIGLTAGPDNGIAETQAAATDVQVIPKGQGSPGAIAITPGPNAILDTALANAQAEWTAIRQAFETWEDVSPAVIRFRNPDPPGDGAPPPPPAAPAMDDFNILVFQTVAENPDLAGGTIGQTYITALATGEILDSDIAFNEDHNLTIGLENVGGAAPWDVDLLNVAIHEIGHFLGLGHSLVVGATMSTRATTPIFNLTLARRSLEADDTNGLNFLYTPDLGDAPDPYKGVFNQFPTRVHQMTGAGTTDFLNSVVGFMPPAKGADHLFGYFPDFQYEWLGDAVDDHPAECTPRLVDIDLFDDGVTLPVMFTAGVPSPVTVQVSTSGLAGRYGAGAREKLYVNGWFDWNQDGIWTTPDEHEIQWGGTPAADLGPFINFVAPGVAAGTNRTLTFSVTPPAIEGNDIKYVWTRFRLDLGENVGAVAPPVSDLALLNDKYAATFGEVEDYLVRVKLIPPTGVNSFWRALLSVPLVLAGLYLMVTRRRRSSDGS